MKPFSPDAGTRTLDPERLSSLFVGMTIGTALLAFFLWWKFHTQMATAILAVQALELEVIGAFTHQFDPLREHLRDAEPEHVSARTLWTLCTITGSVLRWVAIPVIVALALLCLTRAPRERYRRRFGLDGMQAALARIHPLGMAWIGRGTKLTEPAPANQPLRPMDPALRAPEWRERHMTGETRHERFIQGSLALRSQLGHELSGLRSFSPIERTLFLVFALFDQRRKDEALAVLEDLSSALSNPRLKGAPTAFATLSGRYIRSIDRRLSKERFPTALALIGKHAWTRPALLSLLQQARLRSGVVNPGIFASVQLVDRNLWLVLAAASYPRDGRPAHDMTIAPCAEAAAAISHWGAECRAGGPIAQPDFTSILHALDQP